MALVEATVCQKLEGMFGSRAQLTRKARAHDREVLIFELLDHPKACCCYVWEDHGRVAPFWARIRRSACPPKSRASLGAEGNGITA
jgi:hypothetical protein